MPLGAAWSLSSVVGPLLEKTDQGGPESRGASSPALGPGSRDCLEAVEFMPGQPYRSRTAPAYTEVPLLVGSVLRETKKQLCRYAAVGQCRYGDRCVYLHGDACDLCGLRALHPSDEAQRSQHRKSCLQALERNLERPCALERSKDLACGICMEVVYQKAQPRQRSFGILPNCSHIYCLQCIRQWRRAKDFERKVTKACPQCRISSPFVVPSEYWVEDREEKQKLVQKYKEEMSNKACVHYAQGRGSCPFGENCFFKHAYPEGPGQETQGQGAGASRAELEGQ
ncbi:E3 ubiquitin-protein ligase makorin-1 [Heterocephalus glaber]|uniref:RING-type E3 ubiquitin transferase n=1 Tax=Heterocephalus glaber TaxID=10181 RepID=G5C337_HETGA|nr:E3 ubiquitin-protein ligase makorin-1 [Heterocephalus glaber]EHB15949.1 E3 ubiquitin-protein ligase makorin-1 [Heterocephalus glaber]